MTDFSRLSDDELAALYTRAKDPFTAALADEGIDGRLAEIAKSIYSQESGSGSNTKTSNRGAVGGMQILQGTFQRMADKGWDIKDPYDNARAGIRYVKEMYERAGGDPELTAAGYYGGPGGLEKARKGIAVSDPVNPNAPDTLQYGKQVASRLSKDSKPKEEDSPFASMSDDELMAAYNSAKSPKEPEKRESRGMLDEFGRQIGLTARAGISGAAAIPAMMSDAITGPINAGLDAVRGEGNGFRFKRASDALSDTLTAAGLPTPENARERVVQDVAGAMSGAGSMVKAGQVLASGGGQLAKGVGDLLAAGPGLQVTSAATGAGASGMTREGGGGQGAQLIAGLAGGLAPSMLPMAGKATVRGMLRGGEQGRIRAEENLANFEAAGTTPTLGQVTGGRMAQATESLLAKTPGGAGVIAKKAQDQADEMAASVQRLSDELAPGANATSAGEAIDKGVQKFKEMGKLIQQQLYAKLDKHIPPDTRIASERTQAALADLNTDIAGAPELSKWFKNARIQGIEGGLKNDTGSINAVLSRPGMAERVSVLKSQLDDEAARIAAANAERRQLGMKNLEPEITPTQIQGHIEDFLSHQIDSNLPYESIKKLRTMVGKELENNSLVADVPRSKWSALYSALSDDLGVAAKNAGPEAETAWTRANTYTKKLMDRLENVKKVVDKDTPERVFAAATNGTSEGATNITRVINLLPLSERREVAAAVLQRMGRATPGQQNALGEAFSSETFLTNLSKFSPEARQAIFGRTGLKDIEEKLNVFARVAESRREGGRVFANPSGTAPAIAGQMLGGGALYGAGSALAGNPLPLVGVAAGPVVANVAAKTMMNPSAARVAATRTPIAAGTQAAMVGAATRLGDQDRPRDPRLIPMSQRQTAAPYVELRGMAEPKPNPTAAIGEAATVDDAIKAFGDAVKDSTPPAEPPPPPPVPEKVSMTIPGGSSTEPDSVWFGRRGDGYQGAGDAYLAMRARQKLNPSLEWKVEQMPNGRYRIAGYGQGEQMESADAGAGESQDMAFEAVPREDGTVAIRGNPMAIRQALAQQGIRSMPMRDGVMVGTSQAQAALEMLQQLAEA